MFSCQFTCSFVICPLACLGFCSIAGLAMLCPNRCMLRQHVNQRNGAPGDRSDKRPHRIFRVRLNPVLDRTWSGVFTRSFAHSFCFWLLGAAACSVPFCFLSWLVFIFFFLFIFVCFCFVLVLFCFFSCLFICSFVCLLIPAWIHYAFDHVMPSPRQNMLDKHG